jgi:hypothetical protein
MKRPAILLLLCAAALPAAALAQGAAEAQGQSSEMLTTKWSLKQPRKKAPAQIVAGPALPAPQRVKLPKPRQHQSQQRLPNNRTNAAPAIASIIRNKT